MKLILNELKKIFALKSLLAASFVFLFLCFVFPGSVTECELLHTKFASYDYPEQIPLEIDKYSVEQKFNDMLLDEYGQSIDITELARVKEQAELFEKQLRIAVEKDEVLRRNGMQLNDDGEFFSIYEEGKVQIISESEQQYIWECTNGVRQLSDTDYPIYFAKGFRNIVDYFEKQAGGDIVNYDVLGSDVIAGVSTNLQIVLWAIVSSLFIIVPYMTDENSSNVASLEYSSKTGRKSYYSKICAVALSLILTMGIGATVSYVIFSIWDLSRYYTCKINTILFIDKDISYFEFTKKCYSELSLYQLYMTLMICLIICGICTMLIVSIIAYRFDNPVSGFAVCALFVIVPLLFFYRYISYALSFETGELLTNVEPCITVLLILIVSVIVIRFDAYKRKYMDL